MHIIAVLLQPSKVNPLTAKYFNELSFFLLILFSKFSSHTLCIAFGLWFNLLGIIVFLISQPYPTRFQWNLSYPLHYAELLQTVLYIRRCNLPPASHPPTYPHHPPHPHHPSAPTTYPTPSRPSTPYMYNPWYYSGCETSWCYNI